MMKNQARWLACSTVLPLMAAVFGSVVLAWQLPPVEPLLAQARASTHGCARKVRAIEPQQATRLEAECLPARSE